MMNESVCSRNGLTGFVVTVVHRKSGTLFSVFVYWDGQGVSVLNSPSPLPPTITHTPTPTPTTRSEYSYHHHHHHTVSNDRSSVEEGSRTHKQQRSEGMMMGRMSNEDMLAQADRYSSPLRLSTASHLDSLSATTYPTVISLQSGESLVLGDVYAGLIRTDPSNLSHARFSLIERSSIQDIRICVYQPDLQEEDDSRQRKANEQLEKEMYPCYRVTSVWTIRGDMDAVALTKMKMRMDNSMGQDRLLSSSIQFRTIPVGIAKINI